MFLYTEPQKALYALIDAGGAFVNPHGTHLVGIQTACDDAIVEIPTKLSDLTTLEQDDLEAALEGVKTAAGTFKTHTDRVSGVINLGLGSIPDIIQLMGVSRARQQLKRQMGLTDQQALDSGLELFASLYLAETSFTTMISYISTLIVRIEYNPTEYNNVLIMLAEYTTFLQNAGTNDDNAYFTALHELYVSSMMLNLSTFTTPPTTVEIVVDQKIGSPNALNLIEQQREIVDNE